MLQSIYIIVFLACLIFGLSHAENLPNVHPDYKLKTQQKIIRQGYPVETHHVTTEDGYILEMHRIPYGINEPGASVTPRPAILLMVGLIGASAMWVDMEKDRGLGYFLADRGYDVWMGNNRGTTYSRKHVTMNPNKGAKFWDFSYHELGIYDNPAMIDYILKETKQEQMYYIGHSQGGSSFFVMTAERPEYNKKIKKAVLLAPAAYTANMINPYFRLVASQLTLFQQTLRILGINEIFKHTELVDELSIKYCLDDNPMQPMCANLLFMFSGYDEEQLNKTMIHVLSSNTPAGASVKQCVHLMQGINSRKFRQYDYGRRKNLKYYGQENPPDYDATKITTPMTIFFGENDWLVSEIDLRQIISDMINAKVELIKVPYKNFNHLDFVMAIDVVPLLYEKVFEVLQS